jgi:hypothetical protein
MRSRWIRLARDYNYRIRIVYIEPDLEPLSSGTASARIQYPSRSF